MFVSSQMERVSGLYLKDVAGKGKGVFCRQALKSGIEIESCPAIIFNEIDAEFIDKTVLYNYYFSAKFLPNETVAGFNIQDKEKAGIIAFGMLSLCNHSETPNARIEKFIEDGNIRFSLRSLKEILPDEEILISYGTVWFNALS